MHSLKNTVVAVMLLGVTYGVYEAITMPIDNSPVDESLVAPLDIDTGMNPNMASSIEPPKLNANLPKIAQTPPKSKRLPTNPIAKSTKAPALKQVSPPATSSEFVSRAPANDASREKPASMELEEANTILPAKDQELIDALKAQLDSVDEKMEEVKSDFGGEPKGELVSVNAKPAPPSPGPGTIRGAFQPTQPKTTSPAPKAVTAAPATAPAPEEAKPLAHANQLANVWKNVDKMANDGHVRKALETLTPYFSAPELTAVENQRLLGWLDALASKVIYSTEHHFFSRPYIVQPNESLIDIADRWQVTPQLVYNVNRTNIQNPSAIAPGTELKQLVGPFHAEVDLKNQVMTLFVENLYAGRFPIKVDSNTSIKQGQYGVYRKSDTAPTINSEGYMIMLDQGICIRVGSNAGTSPTCIDLSLKDAVDLHSIFTEQSNFFIKK